MEDFDESMPNRYRGLFFMRKHHAIADPESLRKGVCPACGSTRVWIDGRTMLPALMETCDIIISRQLGSLTGVDNPTIGRLKKWHADRPAKDMEAAKVIADEFGVTVEYLLALDPRSCYISPFWESPPSQLACLDCHCEILWEDWPESEEGRS